MGDQARSGGNGPLAPASGAPRRAAPVSVAGDDERLLALVDALFVDSAIGVGLFDEQLRYFRVNPVLSAIIGLPDDRLLGKTIAEAIPGFGDKVLVHMAGVLATGEPVRNMELWGRTPAEQDPARQHCYLVSYFRLRNADGGVVGLASLVIDDTERRRAEAEIALANQRLTLLSRAGELLGSSLDLHQTLTQLADLTVPSFADHCVVDLLDDDGQLRRVALVHTEALPAGADREAWNRGGAVSYPSQHPVVVALSTRQSQLIDDITEERIAGAAPDQASAAFSTEVGLRSLVVVPLIVGGRVLGVISFGLSVSRRHYSPADVDLATEIGGRAAVALDHASAYERQRQVALALQHSLLPGEPPATEGLASEWRYLAGGADAAVGGDWFDLIPLSTGRTGIVIGDVMGRGVRAAAVMGQLRAATRSSAVLDLGPAALLHHLDELVRALDSVQLVTCIYGIFEPARHSVVLASAGHPPPLLLDEEGCRPVPLATGVPLGVGYGGYTEQEIALPPASTLMLYTDGLVERRDRDLAAGIAQLCATLGRLSPGASACDVAIEGMLGSTDHHDDVAIVCVQALPTTSPPSLLDLTFRPSSTTPRQARAHTADALASWGLDECQDLTLLLVSEVVTNAVRHAGTDIHLHVRPSGSVLYVEVTDGDTRLPRLRHHDLDDEGGRGLHLVSSFARRWGVRPTAEGKVVWLEIDTQADHRH